MHQRRGARRRQEARRPAPHARPPPARARVERRIHSGRLPATPTAAPQDWALYSPPRAPGLQPQLHNRCTHCPCSLWSRKPRTPWPGASKSPWQQRRKPSQRRTSARTPTGPLRQRVPETAPEPVPRRLGRTGTLPGRPPPQPRGRLRAAQQRARLPCAPAWSARTGRQGVFVAHVASARDAASGDELARGGANSGEQARLPALPLGCRQLGAPPVANGADPSPRLGSIRTVTGAW